MELDRVWNWQKKKLACRIRPENGNPAADNLREMFAELAGIDLNELLNEMKQTKKKKEQTNKLSFDQDADKTFKEILTRSRVLGATKLALEKMEEYDKQKSTTLTQKNLKKVYSVLPKSPPKRVLLEMQRERSKPLRLPDQEEHKSATDKLEKKLAKQRAARMAAIEQSAKDEQALKKSSSIISDAFNSSRLGTQVFETYEGDLFSSSGPYLEGMLYLSRMADSSVRTKRLSTSSLELEKKKIEPSILLSENEKKPREKTELYDNNSDDHIISNNPDITSKRNCALALCNWARNPANASRLANEGAVRAIMQLSLESDSQVLKFCCAGFRFMSEQSVLATTMIEDGAITTISDLISSHNDDFIIVNLTIALVNLTRVNGKEGQVVEAAIVLAFMNLIMLKPELGTTCVRGLYNLTCVDINYPSIERVIRALVSLSLSGTSNIKHLCAAALCNLSDLKSVRARMVEEGAINVLTALSRGAETRTRRICAVILQNLSAAKSVRVEMASRNSVAAAYGLSSDQDPIILRCIGLTLARLAMEPSNCQRIIHEGGITALCNIAVKYPTIPGITQPVSSAFQLLSSNQPFRINIVNEGSVTAIASLLRSSVDMFTLQHSLLALCNLLCEADNHLPIIQQGLILTLISMSSNENELLKDFCSLAFLNLSCTEDSRKHLVNAGAVASIISVARQSSDVTKKRCAATLCNLSYYSAGMNRMVSDGIIPCIAQLVIAKDITTVHYSCAALCRLCSTVDNAKLILDSGAVPNLVRGAIEGDNITKQFCGSVLSSLSFYEYCRIPLVDLNAISALKGLAELNDDITKQRCLVAFANLSCEISVQLKMIEEGVVSIIAELANSYQEINYICCAKAICNLACCENTRFTVAKEGGVNALMMISMVQSVDRLTKLLCVLGLNNLLDDSTVEFMLGEGLIGSIANISKIGDPHISNLCSKIYNRLTVYNSARLKMIERTSSLTSLFRLSEANALETQVNAIRTCCNLILDSRVREAVVKNGGLFCLEKGLNNSDKDVVGQCLWSIFSLCSNSLFMEQIAKSHIPHQLIKLAKISNGRASEYEIISKCLATLSFDKSSRLHLQKQEFIQDLFYVVSNNLLVEGMRWLSISLRYIVLDYYEVDDLINLDIINTIAIFHKKILEFNPPFAIENYFDLVDVVRTLSDSNSHLALLSETSVLSLMYEASGVFAKNRPPTITSPSDWGLYNIAVILLSFAKTDSFIKYKTATSEISVILQRLSESKLCYDLTSTCFSQYLMDQKSRNCFLTAEVAKSLASMASNIKLTEKNNDTLSNVILSIYAMSKVAICREFMLDSSLQLDRILIQLSGSENSKIKANVNRAYKNLHSDINEAIEEGEVSNLIAMSLEGKMKNQASDEIAMPNISERFDLKTLPPSSKFEKLSEDTDLATYRWFAKFSITKGGAAGKGPEPPEPPFMSTDGSEQYPHMMEELDSGEVEGKTKMAFAKMLCPSSLRESFLLTEADFLPPPEPDESLNEIDENNLDSNGLSANEDEANNLEREAAEKIEEVSLHDRIDENETSLNQENNKDESQSTSEFSPTNSKQRQTRKRNKKEDSLNNQATKLGLYA